MSANSQNNSYNANNFTTNSFTTSKTSNSTNKNSFIRKRYSNDFKFKVALEAIKGDKTINAICKEFGIYDSQVNKWKKQLKEEGPSIFSENSVTSQNQSALELRIKQLNEIIGELSVENKFFKKNFS